MVTISGITLPLYDSTLVAFIALNAAVILAGPCDVIPENQNSSVLQTPSNIFNPVASKLLPPCAQGSTFCDDVEDYPAEYLSKISPASFKMFRDDFGRITLDQTSRRIDASDEHPLCAYVESIVYPKLAKNKDDQWLYVVNTDHMYQGIHVETCISAGSKCAFADYFPAEYNATCVQKYVTRKLVAINPTSGRPQKDDFVLPSCCSCRVVLARRG